MAGMLKYTWTRHVLPAIASVTALLTKLAKPKSSPATTAVGHEAPKEDGKSMAGTEAAAAELVNMELMAMGGIIIQPPTQSEGLL